MRSLLKSLYVFFSVISNKGFHATLNLTTNLRVPAVSVILIVPLFALS